MAYLKFQADYVSTGTVMLRGNYVLIADKAGTIHDIVFTTEAGDDVQQFKGMLTPGFVNCHCHLELSHMQHVTETGTGLVDFLIAVIKQRNFPQEYIFDAMCRA